MSQRALTPHGYSSLVIDNNPECVCSRLCEHLVCVATTHLSPSQSRRMYYRFLAKKATIAEGFKQRARYAALWGYKSFLSDQPCNAAGLET